MRSLGPVALAALPLLLAVRADDFEFDGGDVPSACRSICRPMAELTRQCDGDDLVDGDDAAEREYEKHEHHFLAQCVCTNDSFDVANVASSCADCIKQNMNQGDDDDVRDELEDINKIISACSFSTTATWASSAADAASTVSVSASAVTGMDQLTTTINGGGHSHHTGDAGHDDGNNNSNNNNEDSSSNNEDPDSLAAASAIPMALCGLGAFAAGAAALLL
jgi:hypothetical protein